jgi:hypothetical protein
MDRRLCSANRREIWRCVGKASFAEYLEDVFGYEPKTARERVRVALALDDMPELAETLATGEQSYSALRELTRIATPETQSAWRDAARDKNLRQIEELVAVHRRGDLPTDPPDADLKPRIVRFEVSTATFARLRQAQQVLADECGRQLDDDALVEAMCSAVLDGGEGGVGSDEHAGRAKYQVLATICAACSQGWYDGGGIEVPVSPVAVARAECDAQRVGTDHEPGRAVQDVAPKVHRFVWRRDRGRCCVPGCRARRYLEIHHVVPRAEGGSHDAENLTLLCNGHHDRLHEGTLRITGRAPNLVVTKFHSTPPVGHQESAPAESEQRKLEMPHVGHVTRHSTYSWVVTKTEATQALAQAGFTKGEARVFVETAADVLPRDVSLEQLIRGALKAAG